MRISHLPRRTRSRLMATLVTLTFIVGQVMQPVYAAPASVPPLLSDQPIAAKVAAKPNIFYTLDDSGSMQYNFIPDFVTSTVANVAITKITGSASWRRHIASTAALFNGQFLNIMGTGAIQPEYIGEFWITLSCPHAFPYTIVGAPMTPATGASPTRRLRVLPRRHQCRRPAPRPSRATSRSRRRRSSPRISTA